MFVPAYVVQKQMAHLLVILLVSFSPENTSTERHAFSNGLDTGLANGA
jgi:hypothetical protein